MATDFNRDKDNEDLGFFGTVADIGLAPIRGAAGALGSVYSLADTLAFDALPDLPEESVLGRSRTVAGSLIEGVTQFASAFIPVTGFLSTGAKVGKSLQLAKGLAGSSKAAKIGRSVIGGALTDVIAFDADEERLSNLIQQFPVLENPVTEYLQASPDDGEIEGRLKNAIEGLGIGAAFDLLARPLRKIKAKRAGKAPEEVAAALDEAGLKEAVGTSRREIELLRPHALKDDVAVVKNAGITPDILNEMIDTGLARIDELKGIDPNVNPRTTTQEFLDALKLDRTRMNYEQFPAGDPLRFVNGIEAVMKEKGLGPNPTTKRTWDQLNEESAALMDDFSGAPRGTYLNKLKSEAAHFGTDAEITREIGVRTFARLKTLNFLKDELTTRVKILRSAEGKLRSDVRDKLNVMQLMEDYHTVLSDAYGVRSEAGRLLNVLKVPISAADPSRLRELHESLGGDAITDAFLDQVAEVLEGSGQAGLSKVALGYKTGLRLTQEYWTNSLLSGLTTQAINITSNAAVALYKPFENLVGGSIGAVFGGSPAAFQAIETGAKQYMGLMRAVPDAFKYMKVAFKTNRPVLDLTRKFSAEAGSSAANSLLNAKGIGQALGRDISGPAASFLNGFGAFLSLPMRTLGSADEFFKQLNFRANLHAELHHTAKNKLGLTADEAAAYVTHQFDNYVKEGQALTREHATLQGVKAAEEQGLAAGTKEYDDFVGKYARDNFDPAVAERATFGAQEATFTEAPTGFTKTLVDATRRHPLLKFFTPFVSTPSNLIKFAGRRIDAPGFAAAHFGLKHPEFSRYFNLSESARRSVQDVLSSDPRRKYEALGRLNMGFGVMTFFTGMAAQGLITGRGPDDKNHRQILADAGIPQYSIKVGDKWISYQRADPLATLIGMAADLATYGQYSDVEDADDASVLFSALATAVTANVTNKTYLTGLTNLVEALSNPEEEAPRLIAGLGSGFVPYASFINQAAKVGDPVTRDAQSLLERMMRRIPGLSSDLPAVRNILGEEIKNAQSLGSDGEGWNATNAFIPIQYRAVSSDVIKQELVQLGYPFSPPNRTHRGVNLTTLKAGDTNAYDRYQQLIGQVKLNGASLRQTLTRLIQSPRYQRLSLDPLEGSSSPRVQEIKRVLTEYKRRAFIELKKEVPEIQQSEEQRGSALRFL